MTGAHTASVEQILDRLRARAGEALTEVHMVNGLHPELPFSYYTDLLRGLKRVRPGIHLKCFTAVEIAFFADHYGKTDDRCSSNCARPASIRCPAAAPRSSRRACAARSPTTSATATATSACTAPPTALGMRTNMTMLYGHIETLAERVDHILQVRALQDETGGLQAFIPLAFHNDNNQMRKLPAPTGTDTLRTHAVARLLLDNVDHIKAYWISCGVELAQTALWFGADDLDGTVQEETIYHMAGSTTPTALSTDADRAHHPRRRPRADRARHALQRRARAGRRRRAGAVARRQRARAALELPPEPSSAQLSADSADSRTSSARPARSA